MGFVAAQDGVALANIQSQINSNALIKADNIVGSIQLVSNTSVPSGYLKCNGQAVSRSTYASLFAAIGTTYGTGNGSTTFNVPDLRGEFIRGWDDGRGVDSGRSMGSSQTSDLAPHSHGHLTSTSDSGAIGGTVANYFAKGGTNTTSDIYYSQNSSGTETRPRNIAMMYVIKY